MDISLVVTKLLGIYLAVSGLFLLFRGKTVPHMLKDFFNHPAIVYLTGTILVFLSTLVLFLSDWSGWTIPMVLTWAVLLKGLTYIFFPHALEKLANKKMFASLSTFGVITLVAGLALYFLG